MASPVGDAGAAAVDDWLAAFEDPQAASPRVVTPAREETVNRWRREVQPSQVPSFSVASCGSWFVKLTRPSSVLLEPAYREDLVKTLRTNFEINGSGGTSFR